MDDRSFITGCYEQLLRVWDRYETDPVDLRVDRFQTPHMLL